MFALLLLLSLLFNCNLDSVFAEYLLIRNVTVITRDETNLGPNALTILGQ